MTHKIKRTDLSNPILDSDSYKFSHHLQYPSQTTGMFSYVESRGGKYGHTVFFGLQYILARLPRVTVEHVAEADAFASLHGVPFPVSGWTRIARELDGRLPIRVRAVKEGSIVPTHNVLFTVESTDPETFWAVSWMETALMRAWYPITVCTQSWHIRQIILGYLKSTSDQPDQEINFKLHDFGSRGVSSQESAMIGGAAHLVNFMGSDTVAGVWCANQFYGSEMAGFSIPAAEHSTVTAWGKEGEVDAYRNMLKQFARPGSLVAVVSDSYDLWNAVEKIWGDALRQDVINSGATVVIRPDSGNPPEIVLKTLQLLEARFGVSYNSKGYKVLNHVRVIQGDGINEDSIRQILELATRSGYSASNIAFGMGGALLQKVDRDTQRFAYKCSEVIVAGKAVPVFKDPVTDPGKRSKAGRLDLIRRYGDAGDMHYETVAGSPVPGSELATVYENGELKVVQSLAEIRARARSGE